jgi:hypothetical protein
MGGLETSDGGGDGYGDGGDDGDTGDGNGKGRDGKNSVAHETSSWIVPSIPSIAVLPTSIPSFPAQRTFSAAALVLLAGTHTNKSNGHALSGGIWRMVTTLPSMAFLLDFMMYAHCRC